jgi:hypothetical protein
MYYAAIGNVFPLAGVRSLMIERKGYSTKAQSQAEETLSQQQLKSLLDEVMGQAEKAYAAYMEAERHVAMAYHENEMQVAKAYERAEQ